MTREEIINKAESFGIWYHHIQLADNYWPVSNMQKSWPIWDMIRRVRSGISYVRESVLDIGTMDGMWAFEAEGLGAEYVCATDIWQGNPVGFERANFVKTVKRSPIVIKRADAQYLSRDIPDEKPFGIIQCLGMLYHVENPLLVLRELRKIVRQDGAMLLETAMWHGTVPEPAVRFNSDFGVYHDPTTFWVPNAAGLKDMLKFTGWQPLTDSIQVCQQPPNPIVARICMICRPS